MKIMDRLNFRYLFLKLGHVGFLNWMNDELFVRIAYRLTFKETLDLKNPITFNEKLQWLKINNRNKLQTILADKYLNRDYISNIIGEEYLIPLLGVYKNYEEIDFSTLPKQFVIKTNHDSGGIVICKDSNNLNHSKAKKRVNRSLKNNFYWSQREWPYKNIEPLVIIEKYMEDSITKELRDYKFFCFNGEPKFMFIASDRHTDTKFDFYDINGDNIPVKNGYKNSKELPKLPKNFNKMIELSKKLSKDIRHVRVDFYEIDNKVYFGEMTFYHFSGLVKFEPKEYDYIFGEYLDL